MKSLEQVTRALATAVCLVVSAAPGLPGDKPPVPAAQQTTQQTTQQVGALKVSGPLKGACIIRDGVAETPQGYDASEVGTGYAMKKLGATASLQSLAQQCTGLTYGLLMREFCKDNVGSGLWETALYSGVGHLVGKGCPEGGCHYHSCNNYYGACLVIGDETTFPNYHAPDVMLGNAGYVKRKMGVVSSEEAISAKCTEAVFQSMFSLYCQGNTADPFGLVDWRPVMFDRTGNFTVGLNGPPGQHSCRKTVGYCLVRDKNTPIPPSNAPDEGQGYSKQWEGVGTVTLLGTQQSCTQETFFTMMYALCQKNGQPRQYEWNVVVYDAQAPTKIVTSGCDDTGCTHQCPY